MTRMLTVKQFYAEGVWGLGFGEYGSDYTIVPGRHIGFDVERTGDMSVTPFQLADGPTAPVREFVLDTMSATRFRFLVPGSSSATDRAYTWMAVGY